METLRNPGINLPASGLVAIIATGMLLFFNYNLSRIYIPVKIFYQPPPINVTYLEPTESIETEETIDFSQEPIAKTKTDPNPVNTNPPVTTAPVSLVGIDRPGDILITKIKPNLAFHIPAFSEYFTPEQVERRPRVLRPVTPIYPYQATVSGIEGRVVLRFIVDEDGGVLNPEVVKAEPEGIFEEAALAAIVKYKFIPATIGNKKVKCIAVMPIGFKIN